MTRRRTDPTTDAQTPETTAPEPRTATESVGAEEDTRQDVSEAEDAATEQPAADELEPRSLPWWKNRARTAEWLLAEANAQRDQLQARLDTVQQREVESLVTGTLHDPSDLFRFGPPLAELLDSEGNVDPEKVNTALAAVVAEHPHLSTRHGISPAAPASMVTSRGVPDPTQTNTPTFKDLLSGAVRNR
ncbi:Uncharacterised protein [Mycolicibacterium flavescens]|uniref:hypothetical protein n=1 Tax=Mycobacterium neumannii TaxID=2048551 RepID=UPI000B9421B8|nr:hypothetical protein [Mycobacterium neumannii]VEG39410.1 Uncharacterised protein [Mycolicibacterium flavescens]